MRLDLLLADAAKVDSSTGTVNALGLGWTTTATPTPPSALVMLFWAGWTETNRRFDFRTELLDGDGRPVAINGSGEIAFWGQVEVGRPAGTPEGSEIMTPLVVDVDRGLPLDPGQRYEWRLTVSTIPPAQATVGFTIRSAFAT